MICYLDLATSTCGKTVEQKLSNSDGSLIREGYCFSHLENGQETVIIYIYVFFHGFSDNGPIKLTPMVYHTSHLQELGGALHKSCEMFYTEREQMYTKYA